MVSLALVQFGKEVRKARTAAGLTLEDLSDEMFKNINRKGFVSQVENGKRNLSALTIQKFAEALNLPERVTDPVLGLSLPPADETSPQEAEAEALIAQQSEAAARLKLSEALVIALAYKYAEGNPADFEGALKGLERALEVAAEAKDQLPGNVSDAVTLVEARIKDLNAAGEPDAAEDALWEELERAEAAQVRLIEAGLRQVVLTRNVDRAVALELKRFALDGGGFDDLRGTFADWYQRGRDKGLRFDLEVCITLARHALEIAETNDQRGAALNDLGSALLTLGGRETGTKRLEEAVTVFRKALAELPRKRVPQEWAGTQYNLGGALRTLGAREAGKKRLKEATTAFRHALRERTRERVPLEWATTQNGLGATLQIIGDREIGTKRLKRAVSAYRDALEEQPREYVPLEWATTQNNLGTVLQTLGGGAKPEQNGWRRQ